MMETIAQNLFTNWHFIRWLRLGLGLFVAVQAIQHLDALAGLIAFFFLFQAVTNTGCCGASGCTVPASSKKTIKTEDVEFEEIKSKVK
jgi:hypothetical protein